MRKFQKPRIVKGDFTQIDLQEVFKSHGFLIWDDVFICDKAERSKIQFGIEKGYVALYPLESCKENVIKKVIHILEKSEENV